MSDAASLSSLLAEHPAVQRIEAFVCDVNGVARGKWLARDKAEAIWGKGLPLPRSVFALDIWGADVAGAGLAFGTGDPDGLCREVAGTAALTPWAERPTAQVMLTMAGEGGLPFHAEPRGVLASVAARLGETGVRAVVAVELEFYLIEAEGSAPAPPGAAQRWSDGHGQVLGVDALRRHERLFDALEDACRAQGLPVETMLRENGAGQFEVNLRHVADPLRAADHAVLLKRAVRHVARRHGLRATFMAKPYGDRSGSGMHVHCSLLGADGAPVFASPVFASPGFADPAAGLSPKILHAVAGLVGALPETMLLLAPHANSYRRFRPDSHAPVSASWGVDDRAAAVRVIPGDARTVRIEQRVAGADANPYLVVAAVLAGVAAGLERGEPATRTDAAPALPNEWGSAIDRFARSDFAARWFGAAFRDIFVACKRQDFDGLLARVSDVELQAYLDTV